MGSKGGSPNWSKMEGGGVGVRSLCGCLGKSYFERRSIVMNYTASMTVVIMEYGGFVRN